MKSTPTKIKMLRILHLIVAILCVTQFSIIVAKVTTQSKILEFPGKELHFGDESYLDGKLMYVLCDRNEENVERKCKIIREKAPRSEDTFSCDITLKIDHRQGHSTSDEDSITSIPFGKNKAIVYLIEKGQIASVKINTINLDDCKIEENEITLTNDEIDPELAVTITPYDDSYDVVYQNSNICGIEGLCIVTIDSAGKIIDGPKNTTQVADFITNYPFITAIDPKSRDKGTFYVEANDTDSVYRIEFMDFIIHKPDGSKKRLGKHRYKLSVRKSTSNNLLSFCYNEHRLKYVCKQYDQDGNLKLQEARSAKCTRSALRVEHVYNLPNGGFIMVGENCNFNDYCDLSEYSYIALKYNSLGKRVGWTRVGYLKHKPTDKVVRRESSFYVDGDNNYCLANAIYHSAEVEVNTDGFIETITRFPDKDLYE